MWRGGPDTVERIVAETGGFGADYTFEATGLVQVMQQAVESARMGWALCTVAGVAGKGETLDVIPRRLIQGRRIAPARHLRADARHRRIVRSSTLASAVEGCSITKRIVGLSGSQRLHSR